MNDDDLPVNFVELTKDTQDKITRIIPRNSKILKNCSYYKTLQKIHDGENLENFNHLSILFERNLITRNEEITIHGRITLLANNFEISFRSILILTKVWGLQRLNPLKNFEVECAILQKLFMFSSKSIINDNSKLRVKGILSYSNRRTLLRINPDYFSKLNVYYNDLQLISNYIDELGDTIYELVQQDSNTIKIKNLRRG